MEAQSVHVLARDIPVLVVTTDSSASALVVAEGASDNLPKDAAGVPTTLYTECRNGLAHFAEKDFHPAKDLTRSVCSARA